MSFLLNSHRFAVAGPAFDPLSLFAGGVAGAWYDPSDLSTMWQDTAAVTPITADGQSVARINDKSGNGKYMIQTTAGLRPIYRASGGLHWLAFDTIDDKLASSTSDGGAEVTKIPGYIGTAFSKNLDASSVMMGLVQASSDYPIRITNISTTGRVAAQSRLNSAGIASGQATVSQNVFPPDGTPRVAEALAIPGGTVEMRVNNSVVTSAFAWTTEVGGTSTYQFPVSSSGAGMLDVYGAIFILLVEPTSNQRASIRQYMASKSGVIL